MNKCATQSSLMLIVALFFFISCSDKEKQIVVLKGQLELASEFGKELDDFSGVTITIDTNEGQKSVVSESDGSYVGELGISEEIKKISYEKDGFANQQFIQEFERAESMTVQLIAISSLEVSNFKATENECGSTTCFSLIFEVENFFTEEVEKRFFDLHAYQQNKLLGTQRFFSFQETFSSNMVTPISSNTAKIELELSGLWFLDDLSTNTEIELRLYGATANEVYKYYDPISDVDNSLNPNYGATKVKLN